MASITVAADGQEQKYALENATVTLGRGLESDIRLKDIKASRRHCQIVKTPQGYQCLDLSSGNGTYVNGVQIKQQPLNPGDKIQIGATTITFHDGDGARSASQSQAARAASGMTTKAAAASKTATAQLPAAAPTRKITARVDAVRPTTQAVSKAATQPMAKATQSVKTGTQGIPKTGTQSVRPATGAMKKTTGRAPTARATATQKFHADAKRKKSNPVAILIGIIGAIFLVVVGFILFSSSGDQDAILQHDIQKLLNRAVELENANQLDPAIAEYQKMLTLVGGSDKWKTRAAEWRTRIKELETAKGDLASAQGKFQQFKDRFAKLNDTEAEPFEKELKDFKAQVGGSQLPFLPELEDLILKVGKMIDTKRATDRRSDFQAKRQEINDKFKLGNRKEVPWSDAIRAWKEYIDSKVTDDNKNKAENEIRQINQRAREEFDSIQKKFALGIEEGKKSEALAELKGHRRRFELTESDKQFQKLIEQHDK